MFSYKAGAVKNVPAKSAYFAGGGSMRGINRKIALKFIRLMKSQHGAVAIEYGLIAALISLMILGGVVIIGDEVMGYYDSISEQFIAITDAS